MENSKSLEVEVNGNNFKQEVLESSIPVLVDFLGTLVYALPNVSTYC